MKLLRWGSPGAERPAVLAGEGTILDVSAFAADYDRAFFAGDGVALLDDLVARSASSLPVIDPAGIRIGPPVARPGKIVCIGLNYRDHAQETGAAIPPRPIVFLKDPGTVIGPHDPVHIPRGSQKADWEVELAVVIGKRARYLDSAEAALAHVAGYTISNDVSEREFQLGHSSQWDLGKSCETFNPLGPWLVTADEIGDPQDLGLRLWVDGILRQDSNTSQMIFPVAQIVHYLSQYMVLEPGDVINTGTPAGVALGLPGTPFLTPGQTVELEIDGLGRQRQIFIAAP